MVCGFFEKDVNKCLLIQEMACGNNRLKKGFTQVWLDDLMDLTGVTYRSMSEGSLKGAWTAYRKLGHSPGLQTWSSTCILREDKNLLSYLTSCLLSSPHHSKRDVSKPNLVRISYRNS